MHATTGAWRPTPTQSTCLYYCHGNEASKCVSWFCEALGIIEEALGMYIDDDDRTRRNEEGPYGVIERLQRAHIVLQNSLFSD